MLHSHNHLTRPGSHCNRNNWCIYGFPYKVQPTTTIDDFGCVQWHQRLEEDAWVVPHCPALLHFADCHFHFNVVFTTKVFSYLYKYLFKSPDITYFVIDNAHDNNQEPTLSTKLLITRKDNTCQLLRAHGTFFILKLPIENLPSNASLSTYLERTILNFNDKQGNQMSVYCNGTFCDPPYYCTCATKNTMSNLFSILTLK